MFAPPSSDDAAWMGPAQGNDATIRLTCVAPDDHRPLRDALASFLRAEGIHVFGEARTGFEALRILAVRPAAVVVLDVRLPDLSGVEVARRVAQIAGERTAVVLYTSYVDGKLVADALAVGARAVVLKDAAPEHLMRAIRHVAGGGVYIDPRLLRPPAWRTVGKA